MIEKNIFEILKIIDPDPKREGLTDTPKRMAESLQFLTSGYHSSIEDIFKNALFSSTQKDLIVVSNIEFYSMCEHHLLPFFGKCHIGYIPNNKILGLSKFAEILEVFARRLQVQENLIEELANCIQQYLQPQGLGIVMTAQHLCMSMRGIEKQHATLTTQKFLGELQVPNQQQLFFHLLHS